MKYNISPLKKKRVIIPLVFVVAIGAIGYYVVYGRKATPVFESAKAVRQNVVSVVSVSGRIEPVDRVQVSFLTSGRIEGLLVQEGDKVQAGETLAYLDNAVLNASIEESRAALVQQERQLAEVQSGTRPESVAVNAAGVEQAHSAVESASEAVENAIERGYVIAHSTIRENADQLFTNADKDSAQFGITFTSGNTEYVIRASKDTKLMLDEMRRMINDRFEIWKTLAHDGIRPIQTRTQDALDHLTYIQDFLSTLSETLNRYVSQSAEDSVVYAPYQTSVGGARSTISTLITELLTARQAYEAKATAEAVAERQYELSIADPTKESIAVQEAAVARSRQGIDTLAAQLPNASIVAPINGIVTNITSKSGESVSPASPIMTLISEGVFELQAFIPEADIAKVHVGQEAEVTFDALDRDIPMKAKVVSVSPAETMREGVATYKTILYLDEPSPQLLSGMSADIDIKTDARANVVVIPSRSVIRENGREYVKIHNADDTFTERDIKTGLKGSDGMIEVIAGLSEGDDVVLYIEDKKE